MEYWPSKIMDHHLQRQHFEIFFSWFYLVYLNMQLICLRWSCLGNCKRPRWQLRWWRRPLSVWARRFDAGPNPMDTSAIVREGAVYITASRLTGPKTRYYSITDICINGSTDRLTDIQIRPLSAYPLETVETREWETQSPYFQDHVDWSLESLLVGGVISE